MLQRFLDAVQRDRLFEGGGRAVVAVSGGPDSMALLDLMDEARDLLGLELVVAHADHQMHPGSRKVAAAVAEHSRAVGLPCRSARLALGAAASETSARRARYRWLRAVQEELGASFLVTAHHRDDQAETVLMRVLQGSGPAGLAGIQPVGPHGLRRPLLGFDRQQLEEWIRARGIRPHSDPTNRDSRHLRVWLRQEVLPLIRERSPAVTDHLLRVAEQAGADRRAWDAVLVALPDLDFRVAGSAVDVRRRALIECDRVLYLSILRALARRVGAAVSSQAAARLRPALEGPSGRVVQCGGGLSADIVFDRVRLRRAIAPPPDRVVVDTPSGEVRWSRGWTLRWSTEPAPGQILRSAHETWVRASASLAWRVPHAGDRMWPLGGVGRRSVSRLLMEARIPRPDRTAYPVLTSGQTVIWLPGVCRAEAALPQPEEGAVRLDAQFDGVSQADGRPPDRPGGL